MNTKYKVILITLFFCSLHVNVYTKSNKRYSLTIHDLLSWINDSTNLNRFRKIEYKIPQDAPTFLEPTNFILKRIKNVSLYNQSIKGITAYYNDSCNCFYNVIVFFDSIHTRRILDSIQRYLPLPEPDGGIVVNGEKLNVGNNIIWNLVDKRYSIYYRNGLLYKYSDFWLGNHYKYFDKCDIIYISNDNIASVDFDIKYSYNMLLKRPHITNEENEKYREKVMRKKWSKRNPEAYKGNIYKYRRCSMKLTRKYKIKKLLKK